MVFGLGFNKAKVQGGAEKLVAQGKISAAIAEYRRILGKDPNDLMVLTTLADLYVREGKIEDAVNILYDLGEKCVEAGQVPRAIAVYKRITKVDPDSVQALSRLGELYAMQGLMRDARNHYLQAVEYYSRRKDKEKARDSFERILMLDMENPRLQARMAEFYADTGKQEEAVAIYLSAVERFLDMRQIAEAGQTLDALLKLDPRNSAAMLLLGRFHLDQGQFVQAVETLLPVSPTKEVLDLLFRAYSGMGDAANARAVAVQLLDTHRDFSALAEIADQSVAQGNVDEALEIYEASLESPSAHQVAANILDGLRNILTSQPMHIGALRLMLQVYQSAGNVSEARETTEVLARAYIAQGELEQARQIYTELVSIEPDNPDNLQMLRRVEAQMGLISESPELAEEPAAIAISDLTAEPSSEQAQIETLPPLEEQLVKSCLTESELYKTYRQTGKAIEALESGLAQLPGNIALHEHLVPLYEEAKRYRKAAQSCEVLTQAYVQLGDGERAARYGELTLGYQQKAEEQGPASVEEPVTEERSAFEAEETASSVVPDSISSADDQSQVREVDLSMEWASAVGTEEAAGSVPSENSAVEEIEFYIQAGLVSDATAALERLRERSPSHPSIPQFAERLGITIPEASPAEPAPNVPPNEAPAEAAVSAAEVAAEGNETEGVLAKAKTEPPLSIFPPGHESAAPIALPQTEPAFSLADTLIPVDSLPAAPAFELSLEEPAASTQALSTAAPAPAANPFADLASELEGALQLPEPPTAAPKSQPAAPPPQPAASAVPASSVKSAANQFEDIFAEFQAEMEEPETTEDLETHYNMGVAFKEMALYDEAIGEFQKVHQIAAKKGDNSHLVQCCSLLATCFLEKGLPQLAVKWYQTAIDSPGLDPESSLALLYEMASAYEIAGDQQAALKSFLDVYARNIDYRDVAERIRSIQQAQ